jgi:predicted amidophosphoribosyltransferase
MKYLNQDKNEVKKKYYNKILVEELDNVGLDYGWCGCCSQGIDSRDRICESCLEFCKHLILRTKKAVKSEGHE